MDTKQQLLATLQKKFGFDEFRPGQLEALTSLMSHGRLLCIQPTGHGKSLLYQLPALLLDGMTIVISPLLALMRDQLSQLQNRFGIPAASINTDQSIEENNAAKHAAMHGKIRILFIAPEQLDNLERFNFLLNLPISLLVVDEAHCISTWGHDFRPSYREIIKLAQALTAKNPAIKLLGLTATANDKTEIDIKQQLTVDKKEVIIHRESMNRPNIRLSVIPAKGTSLKLVTLTNLLSTLDGCGLIYCATRENTELVAEYLTTQGIKTVAYHAGIETGEKRSIQNDFIRDKYKVISATNALGMGIDKSNLRYIIHFDFPGSITAYYQEVGRAGRDGLHAEGILLYDPVDSRIQQHFIASSQPDAAEFERVLNILATSGEPLNLNTLKRISGLHPTKLTVMVAELVEQGFIHKKTQNRLQVYVLARKTGRPNLSRYTLQRRAKDAELAAMQHYAEQNKKCLMQILREALGDHKTNSCAQCSICSGLTFKRKESNHLAVTITSWLNKRTVPITLPKKMKKVKAGVAILDGKLRSQDFIHFMRERANVNEQIGISDKLMGLIKDSLSELHKQHGIQCIVPLPSRTWSARNTLIELVAKELGILFFPDLLHWTEQPEARQGELLNNDQRRHNVDKRMRARVDRRLPGGSILLFDDYIGSGATMSEAARALRELDIENDVIPFTIASVKWKLGSKGMI